MSHCFASVASQPQKPNELNRWRALDRDNTPIYMDEMDTIRQHILDAHAASNKAKQAIYLVRKTFSREPEFAQKQRLATRNAIIEARRLFKAALDELELRIANEGGDGPDPLR